MNRRDALVSVGALALESLAGCLELERDAARATPGSPSDGAGAPRNAADGTSAAGFESPGTTDTPGYRMAVDFTETVEEKSIAPDAAADRELSFMCGGISLLDDDGGTLARYDVGRPGDEPRWISGVYVGESGDVGDGTWRWFGGEAGRTEMAFDPARTGGRPPAAALLYGTPATDDEIEADVYFEGTETDHVRFGPRGDWQRYRVDLR